MSNESLTRVLPLVGSIFGIWFNFNQSAFMGAIWIFEKGNAIVTGKPMAEVGHLTSFRAERSPRIILPTRFLVTTRAWHRFASTPGGSSSAQEL